MPVEHPTRRKILTKAVLATIPPMVDGGLTSYEIAEELGCKITTLRVRCSQEKISLRRPGSRSHRPDLLTIRMSREALAQLQNRALLFGTTRANVARELLETIVRDKLYDAVLDNLDPLRLEGITDRCDPDESGTDRIQSRQTFVPASG